MTVLSTVLVTGASTGIGECCALRLASEGFRVLAGVRNPADGARLVARRPDRIAWVELDVTREDQIARAVEQAGPAIAGLVNNAGIVVGGPLEYLPAELLRQQLEVNVVGLHAVTRACLPLIRRARGRVVHVGSISGLVTSPFTGAYAASKHAVEALADALRLELAPEGLHVAVVEPGQIRTPIWTKGLAAFDTIASRLPADGLERYGARLRVLRWMVERAPEHAAPPERVAEAVVHALTAETPRTRYVVGRDARLRFWLSRLLPDRLMDAVVLRALRRLEARVS